MSNFTNSTNGTTSTNNNNKEEMSMNFTKKTGKNTVEVINEITADGTTVEFFYINGERAGIMSTDSEYDKQKAINTIQTIVDNCDSTDTDEIIYQAGMLMMTMAEYNEKGITPDEQVIVEGIDCVISYSDKTIYTIIGEKLADMDDITTPMPTEAIKAILIERAKTALR